MRKISLVSLMAILLFCPAEQDLALPDYVVLLFSSIYASENNKFGIHLTQTQDAAKAAELVNSQGGDWGYVTVVVQDNDRNFQKWQDFFDFCREKHLIPLLRIATHLEKEVWAKPKKEEISAWAEFLDKLNWPVENRYLLIYNEPNHAKEWGGEVNPQEYAKILDFAISVFKEKNPDFFLLNAGFDQAAPNSQTTMDEAKFLREMNFEVPGLLAKLDGWNSHSYPNHGFVGKPLEKGRATVAGYEWELGILKNFGVEKNLPVFITETGWPHKIMDNGKWRRENFYKPETTASYLKEAFEKVWLPDEKVVAVTPFILNYPFPPFANFSWLDEAGNPYPQFEEVEGLTKVKGEPSQEEKYELVSFSSPPFLFTNFLFQGKIILKNSGQSIWGEKPFLIKAQISEGLKLSDLTLSSGVLVKPGEKWSFDYTLETLATHGDFSFSWQGLPQYQIKVFETWKLTNHKDSFLNRLFQDLFSFWSGLKLRLTS